MEEQTFWDVMEASYAPGEANDTEIAAIGHVTALLVADIYSELAKS